MKKVNVKKYELLYQRWLRKLFQQFGEFTRQQALEALDKDTELPPDLVEYFFDKINFGMIDFVFDNVAEKNIEATEEIIEKKVKKPKINLGAKSTKELNRIVHDTVVKNTLFTSINETDLPKKKAKFFEQEKDIIQSELEIILKKRENQLTDFRNSVLFNSPEKTEIFKEKYKEPKYLFADTIGRTEVNNLNRDLGVSMSMGVGAEKFEWATSDDERVRPSHKALNGKIFDIDKFPPEYNDYNCRCSMLPVFDD